MNHKTTLNPTQKQEKDVYDGFSVFLSDTLKVSIYSSPATVLKHVKAFPPTFTVYLFIYFYFTANLDFRLSAESSIAQGLVWVMDAIQ